LAILEQKRLEQETTQRLAEEKRIAEEKKRLEEEAERQRIEEEAKHLAELEQQRQEEEAKRLAELERKEQEAKRIALEEEQRREEEKKQYESELERKRLEEDKRLAEKQAEEKREKEARGKRMSAVYQRLKAKAPKGEWLLDNKTGCSVWDADPWHKMTFAWSGKCIDGMVSGKGIAEWLENGKRKVRFEGEYKDGRENGYGIYEYADGSRYEGEWKDGNHHGHGIYEFANGSRYEGGWKDGKFHGYGIRYNLQITSDAIGSLLSKGEWRNGGLYSGYHEMTNGVDLKIEDGVYLR